VGVIQQCFEGRDLGRAFGLAKRKSFLGRCTPRLPLDPVKGYNLFEALFRDRGHVVIGWIKELATGVGPAVGQLDGRIIPQIKHAVVSGIAVHLQNAAKTLQYIRCVFTRSPRRICKDHTGWFGSVPSSIIVDEALLRIAALYKVEDAICSSAIVRIPG
jgi:hypothetical protein